MTRFASLRATVVTTLSLVTLAAAVPAQTQRSNFSPADAARNHAGGFSNRHVRGELPGTRRWIVQFKTRSFSLDELVAAVQRGDTERASALVASYPARVEKDMAQFEEFLESIGGRVIVKWWIINGCGIEVPEGKISKVIAWPGTWKVEPDLYYAALGCETRTSAPVPDGESIDEYNHEAVRAHQATPSWTGEGHGTGPSTYPIIAICDGGMNFNYTPPQSQPTNRPHAMYYTNGDTGNGTSRLLQFSPGQYVTTVGGATTSQATNPIDDHQDQVAAIAAAADWISDGENDDGQAPGARLLSYNILYWDTLLRTAYSTSASQIAAWNQIATDKWVSQCGPIVRFNIVAANMSFGSSPDPQSGPQIALNNCAVCADVFIATPTGNAGIDLGDTQYCANGLNVGAVKSTFKTYPPPGAGLVFFNGNASRWPTIPTLTWPGYGTFNASTTKRAVSWNSWGNPCPDNLAKSVPQIVACGIWPKVGMRNDESKKATQQGTSLAAPQVVGAAALFRGGPTGDTSWTQPTALETRAAILATAEDISALNTAPTGAGFLRTDRLANLGGTQLTTATATRNNIQANDVGANIISFANFNVVAGQTYGIAIAWNRRTEMPMPPSDWPDLDIEITGATSAVQPRYFITAHDLHDAITVQASATGTISVAVKLVSNPSNRTSITVGYARCLLSDTIPAGVASASVGYYSTGTQGSCSSSHAASAGPPGPIVSVFPSAATSDPNDLYTPTGGWAGSIRDEFPGRIALLPSTGLFPDNAKVGLPIYLGSFPYPVNVAAITLRCKAAKPMVIDVEVYDNTGSGGPDYWSGNPQTPSFGSYPRPGNPVTGGKGKMYVGTDEQDYYATVSFTHPAQTSNGYTVVFTPPPGFDFTYDGTANEPMNLGPRPLLDWSQMKGGLPMAANNFGVRRRNWYYLTQVPNGPWILRGNQAQNGVDTSRMWLMTVQAPTPTQAMTNHGPELSFIGLPKLGSSSFQIHMRHGKPASDLFWLWGTTQTYIQLNAPNNNCYSLAATDLALEYRMLVGNAGEAVKSFPPIPNDPSLAGGVSFTQFLVFDRATSTWYSSNGGSMVFGW